MKLHDVLVTDPLDQYLVVWPSTEYVAVPNLQVYFQPFGTDTGPTVEVPLADQVHVNSTPTLTSTVANTHALNSPLSPAL